MKMRIKIIATLILLVLIVVLAKAGFFWKTSTPEKVYWRGFWIRKSGPVERKNFYYLARKNFYLNFEPNSAHLFISCQSRCEVYLNEKRLQKIGLYSNPPYQYYDYFEVTPFLQKGENLISLLGYNEGVDAFFGPKKPDGLLVQLEIRSPWRKKMIVSNQSWKMDQVKAWEVESQRIWKTSTSFQEIFNADKYSQEWSKIDFNDSHWEKAEIIGLPPQEPWEKLVLRPLPYLEEKIVPLNFFQQGNFSPDTKSDVNNPAVFINSGQKKISTNFPLEINKVTWGNNQFASFKLPQQIVGGVKICFDKGGQGIVDIGYAETLNKEGFPDTGRMMFQGDRLLNPQDNFCWQNFAPRSYKYLILVFRDFTGEVQLQSVEGFKTEYPLKTTDKIDFGDKLLNQIYQIGLETLKINLQETLMDCPVRERAQYIGDARVEALVAAKVFGETEITKKALQEFTWSQNEEGYLAANYPTGRVINIPTYVLQWINMLWEYYQNSQDKETLKNLYPTLLRLTDYFTKHENQTGFLTSEKDWWIFIDHGEMVATQNYSLVLQTSYYGALVDAAKIADILGNGVDQNHFIQKANDLKKKINDYFWVEGKNLFDDCRSEDGFCQHFSSQANYWALYWEVVSKEKKNLLLDNLLNNRHGLPQSQTPYFNGFVAEVLFKNGKEKQAVDFIKNYWGQMIRAGATTWWESFNPETFSTNARMGESMAHAWGSLPSYLLRKYLVPLGD